LHALWKMKRRKVKALGKEENRHTGGPLEAEIKKKLDPR